MVGILDGGAGPQEALRFCTSDLQLLKLGRTEQLFVDMIGNLGAGDGNLPFDYACLCVAIFF